MDILQRVCLDTPDGIKNPGLVGMDIFMARQKKKINLRKGKIKKGMGKGNEKGKRKVVKGKGRHPLQHNW